MTFSQAILLFSVAVVGGALNSLAGGGSFITFPTLMFTGVPSINANATNTVALWPGLVASVGAYRKVIDRKTLRSVVPLIVITFAGSLVGARLLLKTGQSTFDKIVPWLLLTATLLFSIGGRISAWVAGRHAERGHSMWRVAGVTLVQAALGVYIGYFGAGVGIVILALLAVMGMDNIHTMHGLRILLACCGNAMAVAVFIFAHAIFWPQALLMSAGGILGGYGGAYVALKLNPRVLRLSVIVTGCGMSFYFFWRTWSL